MEFKTADLYDQFKDELKIADPVFRDYGGKRTFGGKISTVNVHEDNVIIRKAIDEPGEGRVLVVNGGGSLRLVWRIFHRSGR